MLTTRTHQHGRFGGENPLPYEDAADARRIVTSDPGCDDTLVFCHDEDEAEKNAAATPTITDGDEGGDADRHQDGDR